MRLSAPGEDRYPEATGTLLTEIKAVNKELDAARKGAMEVLPDSGFLALEIFRKETDQVMTSYWS